jgi:putative acetyltransferase
MTGLMKMRWATVEDYNAIGEVMFDAVRNGHSKYNEQQRQAWVPEARNGAKWNARLAEQAIIIAEQNGKIMGFMSLASKLCIDFAYIRPSAQGTGLFRRLYGEIEKIAVANGEARLWVHASLMAEPAFSAMGFTITEKESVQLGGENFDRFVMEKLLT